MQARTAYCTYVSLRHISYFYWTSHLAMNLAESFLAAAPLQAKSKTIHIFGSFLVCGCLVCWQFRFSPFEIEVVRNPLHPSTPQVNNRDGLESKF